MSTLGMPGIGGSLGQCCVCGESFAFECITGKNVRIISVTGIDADLCVHDPKCLDILKANGPDWKTLPEGPLRRAFQEADEARTVAHD